MSTCFTFGSFSAKLSIISFIRSWPCISSFMSSWDISSFENRDSMRSSKTWALPMKEESLQARRRVTLMSRSARTTFLPRSSAMVKAAIISSPGEDSRLSPTRFWKDERTMLAKRRKPLPSLITLMMSRLCQRLLSLRDWYRDSSSSTQTVSGFRLSIRASTSFRLSLRTWAVPTIVISLPYLTI